MARDYTDDGSYWTVRKVGRVYWVTRIKPSGNGDYPWVEIWGGYERAGAAGGAAAQLAYAQGQRDAARRMRGALHDALDQIGLGLPTPLPAPHPALPSMIGSDTRDEDER